jgi:tetratricopeptide (TPR) repeat protein
MPRFHIVQLMSFTVIAAIVVLIIGRPAEAVVVFPILFCVMIVWVSLLPRIPGSLEAVLRKPPEHLDLHIAALERSLTYRSVFRFGPLASARVKLMQLYTQRSRFADAIAQGRDLLARYGTLRSFESHIHLEIATSLDCLGRADEARAERQRAAQSLDIPPVDALGWFVQGRLFGHRQRYDLAIDAYERALKMPSAARQVNLTDARTLLTVACLKAGRFEDAVHCAELALKQENSRSRSFTLTRLAGTALLNLGRVKDQEAYLRRAYELALEAKNNKWIVESLASLANLERSRGNLGTARSMCLEAESLSPESAREAYNVHANICRTEGRFEEALEKLAKASQAAVIEHPKAERHILAIYKLHIVNNRVELGQIDEAWEALREAKAELERDPQLCPWCEALEIRLMALQGAAGESVRRAEKLLCELDVQALGIPVRSHCLVLLGRAFIDATEYQSAIGCFEKFLAETPDRINQPLGYYYLGECRRNLGDLPHALEDFTRATSFAIDSHHARLAARRLRELTNHTSMH